MKFSDKQLKYSIRKFSIGVASVAIGAVYLSMGAHVAHAVENTPSSEQHTRVTGTGKPDSDSSEIETKVETKTVTRTIKYVNAADESKEVVKADTQTVTLERKQGSNEWTTGKWEEKTAPTVDGYDVSGNNTVEEKEVTSLTKDETVLVYYSKKESTSSNSSSTSSTRGRRVRREAEDAPTGETSGNSTGTETTTGSSTGNNEVLNSALTERKGATVQQDQPGISIPKGDEPGANDPNAHLKFDDPKESATVEEMWKIIKNMPDDFQNNERSYLRNMDTLGDNLRFDKDGNVTDDPNGKKLQPGEIREISSFGGWTAIMKKDGTTGKFAVGMKNKEGYFTGWYTDKDGKRQEGGMLGSDAMDRVYVHEQALDRRFKYMLMLAKGRTIANRTDKAQDDSEFDIKTANNKFNKENLNNLPVKEKEDILQHSPNIEGFNGIEKTFTAFSTKYGSRLKIDFVTGYISDYEGSKGTYRIVVKAIKKGDTDGATKEETIYDHTINRIDGVVENEERYSQGVDLKGFNKLIKQLLTEEHEKKVKPLAEARYKEQHPEVKKPKFSDYKYLMPIITKELAEKDKGAVTYELPINQDELQEGKGKLNNKFKEGIPFTVSYATVANKLNNSFSKELDSEVQPNSPIWVNSTEKNSDGIQKGKDPDRVYKILDFVLPTAKKIIYHADTDQLELQTDPEKVAKHRKELNDRLATKEADLKTATDETEITKLKKEISALKAALGSTNAYTYMEARNGSQEAKILGSHMEATEQPSTIEETEYNRIKTNELAAKEKDGLSKFTAYFVEKEKVKRSNVLPDAELSKKITKEIGGDEDKLGKGGYFSTGDISLDKDVVAYKIQVFAENEKRVGVNKQSPRLQYNLPILADFSVIQDTVEASKEVTRRIVDKLVKEKKIPEETGEKLKKELEKSKKTSEIKNNFFGNIAVKYVDTNGNPLSPKDDKTLGEKSADGTYLVKKGSLIESKYDVTSSKLANITTADNKYYTLRSSDNDGWESTSASPTGTVTTGTKVVTFVYEESTPPAKVEGKGVVHFKKQVAENKTEKLTGYDDITLTGNVGEKFSSSDVDTKITELKRRGYDIVTNEFDTKDKTIDSTADVDGEEPSQVYNVIVKERTVTDTETKTVTRTIKYVKIDDSTGKEVEVENAKPTNTKTVKFTRNLTINLVTGLTTNGTWSEKQTLEEVKTPVLTEYVADRSKVESTVVTVDSTDIVEKVVYRKIGSWVPKVPGEKTPTSILYPNDPNDATKAKYPEYPKTPENPGETPNPQPGTPEKPQAPVIPYVEGYVPKVPIDPTKPVGEDNPLKPLEPIDSNDPKKGYKVPELPQDPKKDTVIEYKPNPQKILIKVVNVTTGEEVELPNEKLEFNGVSDQLVTSEDKGKVDKKIESLKQRGYIVSTKNPITETTKYDTKDDSNQKEPTQTYKIVVNEPVTKDTEVRKVTRTIKYVKIDVQDGNEVRTELNTEKIKTKVDKVEFSRNTTTSLTTGLTKIGTWDTETKELSKVNTPVLDGYLASVASVENKSVSPDTESYEVTVVYRKIGSWVPKIPDGVTPPTGTDITPVPYPNDPDDPTKPKNPEYPETPGGNETPGTPEKPTPPVIPYIPGYTPKIGEEPLKPVNPNNPEKGYKVPPVPETPGQDTPITYTADPQKVLVKVVKVEGEGDKKIETPLSNDNVTIDGQTGEQIPTQKVTEKIAELEKRGYVVENKDDVLKYINNKFDTVKDEEGKDPSQNTTLKVHEKVVEVTEPKKPNDPVDPDKPEGPKWPEEGLKESNLKVEVTRTITYVKKETPEGEKIQNASPTKVDKVLYKRNATYNLVTKKVTYGKWTATIDETHPSTGFSTVKTPVLTEYIADTKEVSDAPAAPNENGEVSHMTKEVVYTKLGSWIPKVPGGKTPTPIPYPNDPDDPTKPKNPEYPETPGGNETPGTPEKPTPPVIPYIPGYTPKIGEEPLKPVDPNSPEKGYKVPPVPTTPNDPKTDTPIEYAADSQKAVVKVYNVKDNVETELTNDKLTMSGKTDEVIPTQSLKDKIEELKKRGYIIDEEPLKNGEKFDNQKDSDSQDPTQVFKLKVHEKLVPITPPTDDKPLEPGKPIDPEVPVVPNTPVDPKIPTWTVELINKVKNVEITKVVTRTINYVDEAGAKVTYTVNGNETTESKTDKVTFTREAKINVVTGDIIYGDWKAVNNDTTFDAVTSPVVKGYILKANQVTQDGLVTQDGTSVVASTNLTETSKNQNVNVVYTKLGSWIPTPPTGVTPPKGENFNPRPYPNDPDDPTKPGTPTETVPNVPGYTPMVPTDPTKPVNPNTNPLKPLVPVDPEHPEKGYKVPPVPETPNDPKMDTPITYEGNPQKILIKVVNVTTGIEVPLDNEKLEFNGKSGETVKESDKNSVDDKITSLRNRGYIVDTANPITATTTYDTESDEGKQEPTQTYKLVVREKISIDKESTTVIRTIKYVKIDVQDGNEVRTELNTEKIKTKVDKVEFSRNTTTSLTTGLTEIGAWNHAKQDFSKVDTPVLEGYLANKVSVPSKEVTPESASIEEVVEYRKIGSWIPNVPGGKTPTPIPYPNDPDDPTKPKNPEYPETPGGNETPGTPEKPTPPVIPYVPGYTPKTPDGNPLVPVDPNNPEKGYKVPPVPKTPNDPKENTQIEYTADSQKALVKVYSVKDGVKTQLPNDSVRIDNGKTDAVIPTNTVEAKIKELETRGYTVDNKDLLKDKKFDNQKDSENGEPTQVFELLVRERTSVDTETKTVTRTIKYVKIDNQNGVEVEVEQAKETNTKTVEFTREITLNLVKGTVENGKWSEKQTLEEVKTPVLEGYIADRAKVESREVTGDSTDIEEKVVYRKIGSWIPNVPGGKTPKPIPYPNDPDDPTKPKNPEYPEIPGGNETPGTPEKPTPPVIPYVPGYTPKTPDGNPLVPVDPNNPEKGYKVPPVPKTPNDPKENTQIEYVADTQKAVIKFVVVGEDGKETELETSRITVTGKTGEKIPTENFNDTLKKLTGDPVNNGDYELEENPLKDGATFDKVKDEEGKDPSQIFTVKLRQIYVIPPTPRIVERRSGNTVEVDVPNKDADTLSITFTKRNSTEKETIVTKKDKDGTWKIEKSPEGVTINPTNGRVYIPSNQVQPKTWVDTQTKHKYKQSKIVSVMPNILDVPKFEGTTEWIDVNGNVLRPTEDGLHEKGRIANHVWLESRLEGNKVTHIFFAGSPSVDNPESEYKITIWIDEAGNPLKPDQPGTHEAGDIPGYRFMTTTTTDGVTVHRFKKITPENPNRPTPESNHITIWVDENGKPLKPEKPGTHEAGTIPGYRLITTVTKDGVTIHKFKKITPVDPNRPTPDNPTPELPNTPKPEEPNTPTSVTTTKVELPNTGTASNGFFTAEVAAILAGLGILIPGVKKKETEE